MTGQAIESCVVGVAYRCVSAWVQVRGASVRVGETWVRALVIWTWDMATWPLSSARNPAHRKTVTAALDSNPAGRTEQNPPAGPLTWPGLVLGVRGVVSGLGGLPVSPSGVRQPTWMCPDAKTR